MKRKTNLCLKRVVSLATVLMAVLVFLSFGVFAEDEEPSIMTLEETTVTAGDPIVVHINLPEDHEIVSSDWVAIYDIDVDDNNIYGGIGLGIWCYIGTNSRDYGRPESRQVDVEIDELVSSSGNWPLMPGEYKVILFFNDTYDSVMSIPFTVVGKPTAEPTATPEATPTPELTAVPEPTATPEPPVENKGCGSVVASSAALISVSLLGVAMVLRKKH